MLHTLALIAVLGSARPAAPQIELYTMGQGDYLVEKFGHAALCVVYEQAPARDRCYNYGTTDFSSPPMELGWGFLRGTSKFWVSVMTLDGMLAYYQDRDRTIWRQVLPLAPAQAQAIADKLAFDAREENKYYRYNHFYDNCTTRVRDIVDTGSGGVLRDGADAVYGPTFRELGRQGFAEQTWLVVTAHFILGRGADVHPTLYQAMFLPRVLREQVEAHFGAAAELVYQRQGPSFRSEGSSGHSWILLIALLVAAPIAAARLAGRRLRLALAVSAVPLTFLGLLVWGMAVVSTLRELRYNEAVLVFLPTDFLLAALAARGRLLYARVRLVGLLLVSALLALGLFVQPLATPLLIAAAPLLLVALPPLVRRSA